MDLYRWLGITGHTEYACQQSRYKKSTCTVYACMYYLWFAREVLLRAFWFWACQPSLSPCASCQQMVAAPRRPSLSSTSGAVTTTSQTRSMLVPRERPAVLYFTLSGTMKHCTLLEDMVFQLSKLGFRIGLFTAGWIILHWTGSRRQDYLNLRRVYKSWITNLKSEIEGT